MVLLNGVKYACERCIRGHRVSSCTHTDKPLTMIKPKGRPASQCLHCRELRKLRNTHSSCSCGKKGKSPGQHLASCLCHKNSHCTCSSKDKKEGKIRQKGNDVSLMTGKAIKEEPSEAFHKTKEEQDIFIEDVLIPFDTDQGLLDFFQDGKRLASAEHQVNNTSGSKSYSLDQLPNPPSDADLDLMENMFPLFPLVGANSFDDSRSLPLLPMPNLNGNLVYDSSVTHDGKSFPVSLQNPNHDLEEKAMGDVFSGSTGKVDPTLSNGSMSTHNPRPLRASLSFTHGMHHTSARPKRPESVLLIASTSSNTSKQNLFESSGNLQSIPKLSSSAAFPPYHDGEVGSSDELHRNYLDTANFGNDGQLLSLASDQEDFLNSTRTFSIGATPQSSIPSRQTLQLHRKASISRSHSQVHQYNNSTSKDHFLMPLKSVNSTDLDLESEITTFANVNEPYTPNNSSTITNQEWMPSSEHKATAWVKKDRLLNLQQSGPC